VNLTLTSVALAAAASGLQYHVTLQGPDGALERQCGDPCVIERVEVVGTSGGTTSTEIAGRRDRGPADRGERCEGDCDTARSTEFRITISPSRTLREGVEVRIEDGRAHIILYDVVDTDAGRSTRRRHSEFDIDRPLIELDIYGNDLRIETTGLPGAD